MTVIPSLSWMTRDELHLDTGKGEMDPNKKHTRIECDKFNAT